MTIHNMLMNVLPLKFQHLLFHCNYKIIDTLLEVWKIFILLRKVEKKVSWNEFWTNH